MLENAQESTHFTCPATQNRNPPISLRAAAKTQWTPQADNQGDQPTKVVYDLSFRKSSARWGVSTPAAFARRSGSPQIGSISRGLPARASTSVDGM